MQDLLPWLPKGIKINLKKVISKFAKPRALIFLYVKLHRGPLLKSSTLKPQVQETKYLACNII